MEFSCLVPDHIQHSLEHRFGLFTAHTHTKMIFSILRNHIKSYLFGKYSISCLIFLNNQKSSRHIYKIINLDMYQDMNRIYNKKITLS